MYGWDSYFIIRGLVRDNRLDLAQGMVENFFFEIEHYGAVLNANRTYYLTRSQPPFLTSMILAVYEARKAAGHEDRAWLKKAYGYAVRDHALWTSEPHLAGSTGLARYFDFGNGPAPESLKDETGHLEQVAAYFLSQPGMGRGYVVQKRSSEFTATPCRSAIRATGLRVPPEPWRNSQCSPSGSVALTADYYKGDRAMRESGYDISFRFGPFGAVDASFRARLPEQLAVQDAKRTSQQMSETPGRQEKRGRVAQTCRRTPRSDPELSLGCASAACTSTTTSRNRFSRPTNTSPRLCPMWAGVATPEQASAIMKNLAVFEQPGGLVMSPHETGGQWDYPLCVGSQSACSPTKACAATASTKTPIGPPTNFFQRSRKISGATAPFARNTMRLLALRKRRSPPAIT